MKLQTNPVVIQFRDMTVSFKFLEACECSVKNLENIVLEITYKGA